MHELITKVYSKGVMAEMDKGTQNPMRCADECSRYDVLVE
jgi:hypothetical protein